MVYGAHIILLHRGKIIYGTAFIGKNPKVVYGACIISLHRGKIIYGTDAFTAENQTMASAWCTHHFASQRLIYLWHCHTRGTTKQSNVLHFIFCVAIVLCSLPLAPHAFVPTGAGCGLPTP